MIISFRSMYGRNRRLLGNVTSLMALQGLNYLLPLLTLPYLVRTLGLASYGKVAASQAFVCYFQLIINYGFDFSATRQIAQSRQDVSRISRIFSAVITAKLFLMIVSVLLAFAVIMLIPVLRANAILYLCCLPSVVGAALTPGWLYQGMERMRPVTVISGAGSLVYMTLLFMLVRSEKNLWLAALLPSLISIIIACTCLGQCRSILSVQYVRPTREELRQQFQDGFHLFLTTASITLYTSTNVFLVGMVAGDVQAGLFSSADKVVRAIIGLLGPISLGVFPHVNALAVDSPADSTRFSRKLLLILAPLFLLLSVAIILLAKPVSLLLFGSKALDVAPVLRWMGLTPIVVAISGVLLVQTLMPFRLDSKISRINITAAIVNCVLCAVLASCRGAVGAAISVLITELVVTVWACIIAARFGFFQRARRDVC